MLKRIFWLSIIAAGAWLLWQWFRQRQDEFSDTAPQFAPPRPYAPPLPATAPSRPPAPPATAEAPPAAEPIAPEPPAATSAAALDELFADEPAQPAPAADATPAEGEEIIGYCMRCRTKRPIKDPHEETTESGRRAARGTCPVCGTNMFIFLAAHDDEGDGEGAAQ
jgi:hypothetical protein